MTTIFKEDVRRSMDRVLVAFRYALRALQRRGSFTRFSK